MNHMEEESEILKNRWTSGYHCLGCKELDQGGVQQVIVVVSGWKTFYYSHSAVALFSVPGSTPTPLRPRLTQSISTGREGMHDRHLLMCC
jgi:hypothetical protein